MECKSGLLPKYLLLSVITRLGYFAIQLIKSTKKLNELIFHGPLLIVVLLRSVGAFTIRNRTVYCILIGAFITEAIINGICFHYYHNPKYIVGICLDIFESLWMIFLYPFYLLCEKESNEPKQD